MSRALSKGGLIHLHDLLYKARQHLIKDPNNSFCKKKSITNKVCNNETNKQIHVRNIRSGQDLNQGRLDEKQYHNHGAKKEFFLSQLLSIVFKSGSSHA